jgi:hypothetical protein
MRRSRRIRTWALGPKLDPNAQPDVEETVEVGIDVRMDTSNVRRMVSDNEVSSMLDNARAREMSHVWDELDTLLDQLNKRHPLRVDRLRRDLKWVRKQAAQHDYSWGDEG